MPTAIKKSIPYGRNTLTLETGEIARQAGGAVLASLGDSVVLVTRRRGQACQAGTGLFPADRRLPGKDLRRRTHSRRLLQARRPAFRKGNADFAPDRPPDPAAVSRWLLQRSAGRRDGDVGRSRDRSRHSRDDRRVGGDLAVRHSVQRSDRLPRASATSTANTCSIRARPSSRRPRSSISSSPAPKPPC